MQEILLLFLEKVCEAIFFSMFLILGKKLKEKRLLFTAIMIFEYLILKQLFSYSIWFNVIYIFMSFINLKVIYKEKAQITDIFLFMIASIILIFLSLICGVPKILFNINYLPLLITNRILMFGILYILKDKINNIYVKIFKNWNRNKENKIRSLTLRNISIICFNIMFCVINIMFIWLSFIGKRGV